MKISRADRRIGMTCATISSSLAHPHRGRGRSELPNPLQEQLSLWHPAAICRHPVEKRRMINHRPALAHHLFEVALADPGFAIPAHAQQNQVCWKAAAFEIGHGGHLGEAQSILLPPANECNSADYPPSIAAQCMACIEARKVLANKIQC